jgi:hypothetical protein
LFYHCAVDTKDQRKIASNPKSPIHQELVRSPALSCNASDPVITAGTDAVLVPVQLRPVQTPVVVEVVTGKLLVVPVLLVDVSPVAVVVVVVETVPEQRSITRSVTVTSKVSWLVIVVVARAAVTVVVVVTPVPVPPPPLTVTVTVAPSVPHPVLEPLPPLLLLVPVTVVLSV